MDERKLDRLSATIPPHRDNYNSHTTPTPTPFRTNKTLRKPLTVVRTIGDPKNSLRAIQDHQGP